MSDSQPIIGAAMPSTYLAQHRDWLIENQRDLEIQDFANPNVLDDGRWKQSVDTIKQQLDGYTGRMGIHAPFWNLTLAAYDCKIRTVVQDRFKQALYIAGEINATHMVIHSPLDFLGAPSSPVSPQMAGESVFELVHETLKDAVPQAEAIGCTLVIENIFDKLPTMLTDLVESFDSDYVRQSLDTGHAFIAHVQGAPAPDYFVMTAGNMLAHVHIQDTDGYTDRHWPIGQGRTDWYPLFNAISELESNPRLILEIRDYNKIISSAEYLASLGLVR